MPTTKPRLSIIPSAELLDVLRRLSIVQGRSASAIVVEVLEQALPLLVEVAGTLEALEAAGERARARMASEALGDLDRAQEALQPHLAGILDHFGEIARLASAEDGGDSSERPQPEAAPSSAPPSSNTGVRPSRKGGSRSAAQAHRRQVNG